MEASNTQNNEMEIRFDSRSENEGFARVSVASFLTQLNPTVEEVADVKTAVSEAVTNAIIHGYEQRVEKVHHGECGSGMQACTSCIITVALRPDCSLCEFPHLRCSGIHSYAGYGNECHHLVDIRCCHAWFCFILFK